MKVFDAFRGKSSRSLMDNNKFVFILSLLIAVVCWGSISLVNTKETAEKITVTVPGRQFAAPTYRLVRIKDPKYIDCREVPGESKLWEEFAYEDTQTGYANGGAYEGPKSGFDTLKVEIGPNTVQSVTVVMRPAPKAK